MTSSRPEAHLSIHDVAPHTLDPVRDILQRLGEVGIGPVMLLIIPGLPWDAAGIDQLRTWADEGHVLAGHGRTHRALPTSSLFARVHAALISRGVAEHLSLNEQEIVTLMRDNHAWFGQQGLPTPTHYVPPAWALGPIRRDALRETPFDTVEVLGGVIDVRTGRLHRMPLLGYEADTAARAGFLRAFNAWNLSSARRSGRCARISLHPHDLHLRLSQRILEDIPRCETRPDLPTFPS